MKNPIFRIVGVALVLYFGLFHDKKHPESLGNLMSPENIKSEIEVAKERGNFIISNVNLARQISHDKKKSELLSNNKNSDISIDNIKSGAGEEALECGDEAIIGYIVYNGEDEAIQTFNSKKIILENNQNQILNKLILGMKIGGIISAKIPYGFDSQDKELKENMRFSSSDLRYQVTLLSILKKQAANCQ